MYVNYTVCVYIVPCIIVTVNLLLQFFILRFFILSMTRVFLSKRCFFYFRSIFTLSIKLPPLFHYLWPRGNLFSWSWGTRVASKNCKGYSRARKLQWVKISIPEILFTHILSEASQH